MTETTIITEVMGSASEEQSEAVTVPSEAAESAEISSYETAGAETTVSAVQTETWITITSEFSAASAVSEAIEASSAVAVSSISQSNSVQAFMLLAGVFGVVIDMAVFMRKSKKKKCSADIDLSGLSAKERDEIRMKSQKRKKPKPKRIRKKRVVPKTVQKTLPYKSVCDGYIFEVDDNRFSKTYRFEDVNYSISK